MEQYRSTTRSRKKPKDAGYYFRNGLRIAMGLLFIFSGYVKMVDPMGTAIKFEEYFVSFGMEFFAPAAMVFSFLLNSSEFIIGIALLFGLQMRFTSWCLLLYMGFFTLLTFWLAYALDLVAITNHLFKTNYEVFVVTDCGCFGDFLKMTNKETFYKNVVFILCATLIFWQRGKYRQQTWYYITQWGPVVLMTAFALFVQIFCLLHEPWHDFRPWKVGNFIAGETYSQAPEVDYVFKYKHNENQSIKEITLEEMATIAEDSLLMDDLEKNYTYLDRVEKVIVQGINAKLSDFTIMDIEAKADIKNQVIMSPDYTLIVFAREVMDFSEEGLQVFRKLIHECKAQKFDYVIVTSSLPEEVDTFKRMHNLDIQFYYTDATPLKTAVRNNPGIVLIKEGYVMDKWSYRDMPALGEMTEKFPKYEAKLAKYKKKMPPELPNGKTLEEYFAEEEENDGANTEE